MNRNLAIYIAVFVAVVSLMMYLEYTKPKPIDWRQTYSTHDKIPYGAYVLAHEMPKIFRDKNIQFVENQTIAAFLNDYNYPYNSYQNESYDDSDYLDEDTTAQIADIEENTEYFTDGVYFILKTYDTFTDADQNELLRFVENGSDAFLIVGSLPNIISDSLNCDDDSEFLLQNENFDSVKYSLANENFGKKVYYFPKNKDLNYFSKIDTAKTTILGYFLSDKSQKINFIKQSYGKGNFYINLCPKAFSNYYLLNDTTYSYSINCINYIDKKEIFWDEYKKSIDSPSESILMHIFNNPALHWAWIILLAAGGFYMLFYGKRTQRIIPIIRPLKNTTVEFTKTIGNLYFNNRQHGDLIAKKIKYFLYFVKEKYYLNIEKTDADFANVLHLKSSVSRNIIDRIVFLINKNRDPQYTTEADLREVNSAIDAFYEAIK